MAGSSATLCPHLRVENIIRKGRRVTDALQKERDKINLPFWKEENVQSSGTERTESKEK